MTFIDQIQADIKKVMQERQHQLVVEALQRRATDMTLGDLRLLLSNPLGQNLDNVRLADLLGARPATPTSTAKKTTSSQRARARTPAKKRRPVRRERSAPKSTVEAVFAVLAAAAAPLSSTEIAAKLQVHRTTVRDALHHLGGRVVVHGTSRFTRYSVQQKSKSSTPPAALAKRRAPTVNRTDFDAKILRALPATGATTSTAIQAAVGGTTDQVRDALRRLVEAGKVIHTGLRNKSRYELRPTTP